MSSLWTPYGEHEPEPDAPGRAPAGSVADDDALRTGADAGRAPDAQPPDEAALREAMVQLASIPVPDLVADHALALRQVALIHLGAVPDVPVDLDQAALAVNAMGALVDGLGDQIGEYGPALREAVTQLRLAFVQVSETVKQNQPGAE